MNEKSALQLNIIICLLGIVIGAANIIEDHSKDVIGKDCKLTEPIYGTTFDLNSLHSDLGHRINGDRNDYLEFNLCGDLPNKCNGSAASANLHLDGLTHCFGTESNTKPFYTDGRIYFNLTGGTCNKKQLYRLIVVLVCDYSSHVQEPMHLMPYGGKCEYIVMWRTPVACHSLSAPLNSNTCTAKDPKTNHIFNLMPLSYLYNSKVLFKNGLEFIINVCKPVLHGHSEMCPPNSSICLVNTTETDMKKKFINYGTTVPEPTYENGELFMRFKSNETCSTDRTKNISSIITFTCDEKAESKGEPEFLTVKDCEYRFKWATAYACNKVTPCRVSDPINDFVYDLTELSGKKYDVAHGNDTYTFGICTSPKEPCLDNAGACLTTKSQSSSLGIISDNLRLPEVSGAPYLLYETGSACESLQRKWTTKIEFICQDDDMKPGPKIIEDSNCTLLIQFVTKTVCQNAIRCSVFDIYSDRQIDLTPLKSTTHNYLARIDDQLKLKETNNTLYYMNVCRPLVPQYGLSCKGNSAACRALLNGTKNPEQEQSLGYPHASLTIVNTDTGSRPQLKYLRGDVCPHDPKTFLSSQVEFNCDPAAGKGTPILKSIQNDCHYEFVWPTNVICETHIGQFREETCEIYDKQLDKSFDMRKLFKDGLINANTSNGKPVELNACKNNTRIEIDYSQSTVKSFFDAKGPCGKDEIINVEMRLVCSELESQSFTTDNSCGLVHVMETPQICPHLAIVLEKTKMNITTIDKNAAATTSLPNISSGLSTLGIILLTSTFVAAIMVALTLTFRDTDRRNYILSLFRKGNVTVHYSRENLFDN